MNQPLYTKRLPRIGFHYFPDTVHYRKSDLDVWLPAITALGSSWLTLIAPVNRAIPESFLHRLISNNIEPILHLHLSITPPPSPQDLQPLFKAYAHWGVRYVILFDRPNLRTAWPASTWAEKFLVERFIDIYLPIADIAHQSGLTPVFPPLEPGGDYWDTAFIRLAAQSLCRRRCNLSPNPWVMSCYARASNRPLDWGSGGPERWPGARPYGNPTGEQDQRGFKIYEWYLSLAKAELSQPCEIILLEAGCRPGDQAYQDAPAIDEISHAWQNIEIARQVCESTDASEISSEVLACNFWLLSAAKDSPFASHGWFQPNGRALPVVGAFHQWLNSLPVSIESKGWHTSCTSPYVV